MPDERRLHGDATQLESIQARVEVEGTKAVQEAGEGEEAYILLELRTQYMAVTGEQDAPAGILAHLARSGAKIYGEHPAADQESHARDAHKMSTMAPPELKLAMLFHDIGKAGPDYADAPLSKLIARMYAYNFPYIDEDRLPSEISVEDFLAAMIKHEPSLQDESEKTKADFITRLRDMLDLPSGASMRDFYDAHIEWGVRLHENTKFMDNSTAFVAFGHHILPRIMAGDIAPIQRGERQMRRGIIPFIAGYTPNAEDLRLAAGAQAFDHCNARFTRSNVGIDVAVAQTREALYFAIDNGGYKHMIDMYKQRGVDIECSEDDIARIKEYIDEILRIYLESIHNGESV